MKRKNTPEFNAREALAPITAVIVSVFMLAIGGCNSALTPGTVVTVGEVTVVATQSMASTISASTPTPIVTVSDATLDAVFGATVLAAKETDRALVIVEWTTSPQPTSVPVPTGTREADQYFQSEMRKMGMELVNMWSGDVDGRRVGVWAGASLSDLTQGVVYVMGRWPQRSFEPPFVAPEAHGALRIIAEQNNRLTLEAVDGTLIYFDLPGMVFVTSPTEIVSTALPPPTYTPFAP